MHTFYLAFLLNFDFINHYVGRSTWFCIPAGGVLNRAHWNIDLRIRISLLNSLPGAYN